jgi:hypothetical protein
MILFNTYYHLVTYFYDTTQRLVACYLGYYEYLYCTVGEILILGQCIVTSASIHGWYATTPRTKQNNSSRPRPHL